MMRCSSDPVIPGPDLDHEKKKTMDSAGKTKLLCRTEKQMFKSLTLKQNCDLDYMRYVNHN